MFLLKTIARPYAQAIFQFAIENNSIDKWKKMLILMNEIISHNKIKHFLSGFVSPQYLLTFFLSIGKNKFNQYEINFIKILALNHRFNALHAILKQFLLLESLHKNIIHIKLISSYSLKKHQIKNIHNILQKSLSGEISLIQKIDNTVLEGIIIKIGNTVFNLSFRYYLKQLSHILKS